MDLLTKPLKRLFQILKICFINQFTVLIIMIQFLIFLNEKQY